MLAFALGLSLLQSVGRHLAESHERMGELATAKAEQRVALALTRLAGVAGEPTNGGVRIELSVSREDVAQMVMDAIVTTGRWDGEARLRRRDGTVFPALLSHTIVHDDSGEPTAIVGAAFDLTDVRQAEALATEHKATADSVMNSVRFPTAILDGSGRIAAVNRAWNEVAVAGGLRPEEVGPGVDYLAVCDASGEADAIAIGNGIRSVLDEEVDHFSAEYGLEMDGEQHWYRIEVASPESTSLGAIVLHIDITALRQATEEATDLAESRRRLLASVSHELRTPLTAILGFAGLSEYVSDAERAQFIREIQTQASDMAGIIEDLLVAARSERGDVTIAPRTVDLAVEARRSVEAISNRRGKTIEVDADEVVECFADPLRLRQIIRNLLTNAIRYGGDNICVAVEENGDRARLTVTDDGRGIDPERFERIFHPFESAHPNEGQPDSLGIGLAVSRNLAELMGGSITYTRSDDATTFELTLPRTAD